jgi:CheY-like chemotaxis protein
MFPYAVRLIGFSITEQVDIGALLAQAPLAGPSYVCLHQDSLQSPDLYIVNGDDLSALARLSGANPSAIKPALIVGAMQAEFPFPQVSRPLTMFRLYEALGELLDERTRALTLLDADELQSPAERRRQHRLDVDVTDPRVNENRRQPTPRGAIVIVDHNANLRERVASLLSPLKASVEWTDSAATALRLCEETPVSLVLINTAAVQGLDPYQLSATIKRQRSATRIAVVFLNNRAFHYDTLKARAARVRGLLDTPVEDRHLVGMLTKLMSLRGVVRERD